MNNIILLLYLLGITIIIMIIIVAIVGMITRLSLYYTVVSLTTSGADEFTVFVFKYEVRYFITLLVIPFTTLRAVCHHVIFTLWHPIYIHRKHEFSLSSLEVKHASLQKEIVPFFCS